MNSYETELWIVVLLLFLACVKKHRRRPEEEGLASTTRFVLRSADGGEVIRPVYLHKWNALIDSFLDDEAARIRDKVSDTIDEMLPAIHQATMETIQAEASSYYVPSDAERTFTRRDGYKNMKPVSKPNMTVAISMKAPPGSNKGWGMAVPRPDGVKASAFNGMLSQLGKRITVQEIPS